MREQLYLERVIRQMEDWPGIDMPKEFSLLEKLEHMRALLCHSICKEMVSKEKKFDPDDVNGPFHLWGFIERFFQEEAQIYRIAEKFGEHLDKTLLKIPSSVIPYKDGKYYLIEFPKRFHDEGTGEYHSTALVYVGKTVSLKIPGTNKIFETGFTDCDHGMTFLFPDENKNGALGEKFSYVRFDPYLLGPAGTVEEIIDDNILKIRGVSPGYLRTLVRFTIKCMLYIESGEPDLKSEPGHVITTKNPKKIKRQLRDFCPFPVVNVGYGLHGRTYSKEETGVVGHYRWQPYGPGRSQVKLVWIEEHTRKFNKVT